MKVALLLAVTVFVVPGAVTALKHRWLLFAAGLLIGPVLWYVGLVLPARPQSWWYWHIYSEERRGRVEQERARLEHVPSTKALARILRRR
jgi:hypothetical protein